MEFKKELKRIKRFIQSARKRGYEFDDNVLPKQPKRITRKKLEEIKNIKPSNLYDKARNFYRSRGQKNRALSCKFKS